MPFPHPVFHYTMFHRCTFSCNQSWRDDTKSKNILFYHDALFSISMQVTRRGIRHWYCRENNTLLGKNMQTSLGDRFWKFWTTITAAGQNPVGRQNCIVFRRKARQDVRELPCQFAQFSRGDLDWSSNWDLCNLFGEDSAGSKRHWQKNLRSFLEEHKVGMWELLVKIAQSWETVWAWIILHNF